MMMMMRGLCQRSGVGRWPLYLQRLSSQAMAAGNSTPRISSLARSNLQRMERVNRTCWTRERGFPQQHRALSVSSMDTHVAPLVRDTAMGYWLLGVGAGVFAMVVLGGVTRLTRSGLSMVDWRPQGSMPPRTKEEWEREFEKYKQYPEYKLINQSMTLDEFKSIYYMEWAHRMWGRGLGIIYGLPLVYILARGSPQRIPGMTPKLLGLLALGGAQGLVGWWMVKSGLETPKTKTGEPRVSPYRLAAHLVTALTLYSGLVWAGLTCLNPNPIIEPSKVVLRMRRIGMLGVVATGITFVSGAFVAGNGAGYAYNDWPMYAGKWVPEELWDSDLAPQWRNFFENTATVQFDHRNFAYTTTAIVLGILAAARNPKVWKVLPPYSRLGFNALAGAVLLQVGLGITTLMMIVPVELGAAHQAGALVVWSCAIYAQHALRFLRML